ncbi:MAG: DpnII family type II restriction endonuclease [Candidatus Cloacimonetes bacterium]|jgi:hypothetical protein|nr:DpnII family type II restriction endonuclease [Candidatus Cloacimonadota bacterium]MDD4277746.1 DpnII family type II restriction endonuclease [Candidatus Cloacimonadota bacterium]
MEKTRLDKFDTVINLNTFYFLDETFENQYEGHITALKDTLLMVRQKLNEQQGSPNAKVIFEELLSKEYGLRALLALSGVSNESLKRIITLIRIVDDAELSKLVNKDKWPVVKGNNLSEWGDAKIASLIKENNDFAKGILNLFFEGSTIPILSRTIPLFELNKFRMGKLKFEIPELIDTIVRYKERGSRSGKADNNAEKTIKDILESMNVDYQSGDLTDLIANKPIRKRTMDFIIPNKQDPKIIIECSYLVTTSSGQGDKSKTEVAVKELIKEHYPKAKFIGFIDGIGWYVRKGDLNRMVTAFDDVFTFHKDELTRFEAYIKNVLGLDEDANNAN